MKSSKNQDLSFRFSYTRSRIKSFNHQIISSRKNQDFLDLTSWKQARIKIIDRIKNSRNGVSRICNQDTKFSLSQLKHRTVRQKCMAHKLKFQTKLIFIPGNRNFVEALQRERPLNIFNFPLQIWKPMIFELLGSILKGSQILSF